MTMNVARTEVPQNTGPVAGMKAFPG
jgi:hypothetical protein